MFNWNRFLLMLRLEIALSGRSYLLRSIVIVLFLSLPLFNTFMNLFEYDYNSFGVVVLSLSSTLLMYEALGIYSSRNLGKQAFMIPATMLEKLLAIFVINTFFLLFVSGMYYGFSEISAQEDVSKQLNHFGLFRVFVVITILFLIQAFFVGGSLVFKKFSYLISIFVFIILGLSFIFINRRFGFLMSEANSIFYPVSLYEWKLGYYKINPEYGVYFQGDYRVFDVEYSKILRNWIHCMATIIVLSGLWLSTYFRLQEKQL